MEKQVHTNLCGAKTRSGLPCKNRAMPNGRCRMHGGASTGAPKGNKNAVKTGEFETIWLDTLEEEERDLVYTIDMDQVKQLDNEIKLTEVRIRRMMMRIKKLKDEKMVLVESKQGIERGQEVDLNIFEDANKRIQDIEDALTRVQGHKRQLIEAKAKLQNDVATTQENNVAELLEGVINAVNE